MDNCLTLKCFIDLFIAKKKKLYCAFEDYQKAFYTVWRDGLWYKLSKIGIHGKLYNVIVNMYKNVKSYVSAHGKKSPTFLSSMGVRQGENVSPLLFALFINDIEDYLILSGSSSVSFCDEECDLYMKLLVLMYADDTIILANSSQELQKSLDGLASYCDYWKLKVNSDKTKVMIFGSRKSNNLKQKYLYKGNELETVNDFKYLGIVFNYNGHFHLCKKTLYQQATRAMFSLLSKCKKHSLPVDMQLELFDKMVVPVLTYGCEIWGFEDLKVIEKLHMKFCKYILGVKNSTSHNMVYGELGRVPISITIKTRMMCFWLRIVQGKEEKLVKSLYNVMYEMYNTDVFKSMWLDKIRSIAIECGQHQIWLTQGHGVTAEWMKMFIKQSLKDQFVNEWYNEVSQSDKCILYKTYKSNFGIEKYLLNTPENIYKPLVQYRTLNSKLPIEIGRYQNVDRHDRHCKLCNLNTIGDEYHYILECTNLEITTARKRYLSSYFRVKPSMYKFVDLMMSTSTNVPLAVKVSKLVALIMKVVT